MQLAVRYTWHDERIKEISCDNKAIKHTLSVSKVSYRHSIPATCFGHLSHHAQACALQRIDTSEIYRSFLTNA
jgi:hypothetical protein